MKLMILFSEEIFAIFEYYIHNKRYIYMEPKMRAIFNFANAFEITKFAKLKDS